MPLLDRQRQGVVLGAIRIGNQVPGRDGKMRPSKLTTFRLTSPDQHKITSAAEVYGGTPRPWEPGNNQPGQWEVITEADRMPVTVPPGSPVEQDYMLFGGRPVVRQRLCDGRIERMSGEPCKCPADLLQRRTRAAVGAACKPTTRLQLILADLPGLGVWQLTSRGDSAADELAATAELIRQAAAAGTYLPAVLRLEQRRSTGSGEVHQYAVPVLDIGASLTAIQSGAFSTGLPAVTSGARTALTASQAELPPPPPPGPPAEPLPPPVGAPTSAQALRDLAMAATTTAAVVELRKIGERNGWLDEYVDDDSGVSEPLDNALHARWEVLRGPE